jgi:hypothetical protein
VEIKLSRHARRRAKLYGISPSTISEALARANLSQGSQEIVVDVAGLTYPLKIVVFTEEDIATVVTAYPLKRGDRR